MTAMPEPELEPTPEDTASGHDDTATTGRPVVVRRNAGLAALVGGVASAVAIAYLARAAQSGAPLDCRTSSTPAPRCWLPTTSASGSAWAASGAGCRGTPSARSASSPAAGCCATAG